MQFKVILRPDMEDGGYNVSCPALPGCHSQGETESEAIANIQEAIEGCLEALNEPGSTGFCGHVFSRCL